MKSKLDCTHITMVTLRNQIRAELNQVRRKNNPNFSKPGSSAKKHFPEKENKSTDIAKPRNGFVDHPNRKHYQPGSILLTTVNTHKHRRHYRDAEKSLDLSYQARRKTSAYSRTETSPLKTEHSTSLQVGEKIKPEKPKGKRVPAKCPSLVDLISRGI